MILLKVINYLSGYHKVKVESSYAERVINQLMRNNINYWELRREESGELVFFISHKEYKLLSDIIDKNSCKVYDVYVKGLPFVLKRYRKRYGMIAGFAVFLAVLNVSSLFIWDIKVVSKTDLSHEQIISNLNELGCGVGTYIPAVDFDELCYKYVQTYEDCGWISVNVKGTTAEVELRPRVKAPEKDESPCNLVAAYDGMIEEFAIFKGKSHISVGSVVKKGDLLVSGIVEDKNGSLRIVRSSGVVYAKTNHTFEVVVPYEHKEKVYKDNSVKKRSILFFGREFKLFLKKFEPNEKYEANTDISGLVLFGVIKLPMSLKTEIYREITYASATYSEEEAAEIADEQMDTMISEKLGNADILSITTSEEKTENEYILKCNIDCIMDIAAENKITKG